MKNQLIVNCPTCNKKVEWLESSKYRPFCCKRCQLIDLGEWAEENHKIAGASLIDELNDFDEFALGDDYNGMDEC